MNLHEQSLKMAARLKDLRNEAGLSHQKLSEEIEKQYGIKVSKDSLINYEVSDPHHTKAYKNMGMRMEYICCLADFFQVSTDYLMGLSDCKSLSNVNIQDELNLSEDAILNIKELIPNEAQNWVWFDEENADEYASVSSHLDKPFVIYAVNKIAIINGILSSKYAIHSLCEAVSREFNIHCWKDVEQSLMAIPQGTELDNDKLKDISNKRIELNRFISFLQWRNSKKSERLSFFIADNIFSHSTIYPFEKAQNRPDLLSENANDRKTKQYIREAFSDKIYETKKNVIKAEKRQTFYNETDKQISAIITGDKTTKDFDEWLDKVQEGVITF